MIILYYTHMLVGPLNTHWKFQISSVSSEQEEHKTYSKKDNQSLRKIYFLFPEEWWV